MSLPALPEGFQWTSEPWGPALRCRPLSDLATHVFTTRQLGLRQGAEEAADWKALSDTLGVEPSGLVRVKQVHGRAVLVVKAPNEATRAATEADAIVSCDPNAAIVVRTADCVPILMADPRTGAVAAVHAGWRGMAAGAISATLDALHRDFQVVSSDLVAAIGPSIGPCCYEVGSELVDAFARAGHARRLIDRWFLSPPLHASEKSPLRLDLWTAARDQLVLAGLDDARVYTCGLCTASNLDVLYSYRAEGAGTGRLAAAIKPRIR